MDWVAIAHLVRPRGNKGELAAESLTLRPERFENLRTVHLLPSGRDVEVERVWWHQDRPVFKFVGVDSISDAEAVGKQDVCVPKSERVALEPGEYFYSDLVGCEVFEHGVALGRVTDYLETGGPILLEVGELLIPFVPAICVAVDLESKPIDVQLPEGLKEL